MTFKTFTSGLAIIIVVSSTAFAQNGNAQIESQAVNATDKSVPLDDGNESGSRQDWAWEIARSTMQNKQNPEMESDRALVPKYIGETEKNLNTRAAEHDKKNDVLQFDEADAFFAKRSAQEGRGLTDRDFNARCEQLNKEEGSCGQTQDEPQSTNGPIKKPESSAQTTQKLKWSHENGAYELPNE